MSQNGKGSRDRVLNKKRFDMNWDEISWDDPKCCNCGVTINRRHLKSHPELYIIHADNQIECKNCNFN